MAKSTGEVTLKRLRNRYRLVVMNDDTYEEVVTFKLTRLSVYVVLSTIFVLLVGLTVALIVFTPLKHYIPGAANPTTNKEFRELKIQVDDLSRQVQQQNLYIDGVKKVLSGENSIVLDTTLIEIPKTEFIDD